MSSLLQRIRPVLIGEIHPNRVRIIFSLPPEEGSYSACKAESLWAESVGEDCYRIQNVPFFVFGIGLGDIVKATAREDGCYRFDKLITLSGHSAARVLVVDPADAPKLRSQLAGFGCSCEASQLPTLFAVDVPPEASWPDIAAFLEEAAGCGVLEYEASALRHSESEVSA